jgi:hypothetical protein
MRPDVVLVFGDLSYNARDAEYEQARDLLSPLHVPYLTRFLRAHATTREPLERLYCGGNGRSSTTRFITIVEVSRCTPGSVASFSSRTV